MKTLSLKLQEPTFHELEKLLVQVQKSRNAYINEAIAYYNRLQLRRLLANQLEHECLLVKAADYAVFQALESMENPID